MFEVKVPELAESITEATIAKWMKAKGDPVGQGDVLVELETDKVNMEISADHEGVLGEVLRGPGDTVQVGEVIAIIQAAGEGGAVAPQAPTPTATEAKVEKAQPVTAAASAAIATPSVAGNAAQGILAATPAARKLARERGIDLSQVRSQDPLGRVNVDDVKVSGQAPTAPARSAQPAAAVPQAAAPTSAPTNPAKPVERVQMSKRRQTIADRLVAAQHTAAMLTTFNEVDMTKILDIRKRRQEKFVKEHDIKLGFMSFFTKAVVGALKAFPLLNAEIQGTELLVKKYYDIGIAVSANEGLVVPVVREADRLSFAAMEQEIASLAKKARNNQLKLSDLQGGTFTITNGGTFGSLMSTPILNAPQVGILGMHKIQLRPVAIDDERMENRPMMYIALSYDHRIVDGSEAVSFLVKVKAMLEDPETLLLEG
jgi:2-oxoglutarate dehydrogenase E2 component (dihydrolipoamide succinyltransferase)